MRFLKSIIYLLPFLFIFFQSCSLWDNFTTYFNLYYNATDLFQQAEESIKEQKTDLFSANEVALPSSANQLLGKVIEKCSDLLQFNSESAYVEDALMMLGKSFYYQKNYQKSLRKFIELEETFPESGYFLESQLWIGKCQMRLKNYNDALTTLSIVRKQAVDEGESDLIRESYVEEIVYKVTIEDYKRDYIRRHLDELPAEDVLSRFKPEERLSGLKPEEMC